MYLNEEYNQEKIENALDANDQAMDLVYNAVIAPNDKFTTCITFTSGFENGCKVS